jgi:hypothetical protein
MLLKNIKNLTTKSVKLVNHLFKMFFNTFNMNINLNNIFDLFDDTQDQKSDDDISLLIDFSQHPFYWIGGFNKIISNQPYFQQYAINLVKDNPGELDFEEIKLTGEKLMFDKAWAYICNFDLNNQFHIECINKKSSSNLLENLRCTMNHFEYSEEYEKCALLKGIENIVISFLK